MAYLRNYDASKDGLRIKGGAYLPNAGDQATFTGSTYVGNGRYLEYYEMPQSTINYTVLSNYNYNPVVLESVTFFDGAATTLKFSGVYATPAMFLQGFRTLLAYNDTIVGNKYDDVILSFDGKDEIQGNGGDDRLNGGSGDDRIYAGSGEDVLVGGAGKDALVGGNDGDGDGFIFLRSTDTGVGAEADVVSNFTHGADIINLHHIDARSGTSPNNDFAWSGRSAADFSVWWRDDGRDIIVRGDVTGDAKADFEIVLRDVARVGETDFVL